MPFTTADVGKHTKKATTPKQKRQWVAVANSALNRGLPEGRAIASANAVVARTGKK